MKSNYKPQQPSKYPSGPNITLGHADTRSATTGYSQAPVNNVWAANPRAHYQPPSQNSSNSWLESTRTPYDYDASFTQQRDPVADPYSAPQVPSSYYGHGQRAASSPSNYYDQGPRYGDYRSEAVAPVAPNPYAGYGQPSIRPLYDNSRMYPPAQNYYTPPGANRGNFVQPQQRSYGGGMSNSLQMRGRNQKRPFQQNKGYNNGKRKIGDLKRPFNSDDKKKPVGVINKAAPSTNKTNGSSPAKEGKPAINNAVNQSPNEKGDQRAIPKAMMEDLAAYFEKSKSMGETRRRTARFKFFRVFSFPPDQGLSATTTTEQVGTFAKRGQLRMTVALKTFFPQVFGAEAKGNLEYEDASYDCATSLMLKMNKLGLLPVDYIANFYDKKPHYNHELFERAKQCFQLLVEETEKHQFTSDFKEGKLESAEQSEWLQSCIDKVAERIRSNDLPPLAKKNGDKPAESEAAGGVEEKPAEEESADPPAATEAVELADVEAEQAEEPAEATADTNDGESDAKRAKLDADDPNPLNDLACTDEA